MSSDTYFLEHDRYFAMIWASGESPKLEQIQALVVCPVNSYPSVMIQS